MLQSSGGGGGGGYRTLEIIMGGHTDILLRTK